MLTLSEYESLREGSIIVITSRHVLMRIKRTTEFVVSKLERNTDGEITHICVRDPALGVQNIVELDDIFTSRLQAAKYIVGQIKNERNERSEHQTKYTRYDDLDAEIATCIEVLCNSARERMVVLGETTT